MIAGGHFAAFNAERLLKERPAFDSVAIGEGEEFGDRCIYWIIWDVLAV